MRKLAKTFQALSDTNRIRILKMLEVRLLCVCEITEILKLANSTFSKHQSILRESEFILDEKDGKWVNYFFSRSKNDDYVSELLPLISILQGLLNSGMRKGPALALLLAGPAISLPNMLVIRGGIGTQKTVVYVILVVIMATISGLVYGSYF